METVLIVIHLIIVIAMVTVVLLQRSEGGGLGIGGGGNNMMASRASANPLTRITGFLALAFFITSLGLGILARYERGPTSILDQIETETEGTGQGILDQLGPAPTDSGSAPAQSDGEGAAIPEGEAIPGSGSSSGSGDIPTGQ